MKNAFEDLGRKHLISLDAIKTKYPNMRWNDWSSSTKTPSKSHSSSSQSSDSHYRGQSGQSKGAETPSQGGRPKAKLTRLADTTMANIPVKVFQFSNGLVVKVYTGSIVKFHGDAIVISADMSLSGVGFLSEAVRKAGGPEYKKEFDEMRTKTRAKLGDVVHCKGGKLGARYVMHLILNQLSSTQGNKLAEYKNHLKDVLEDVQGLSWKKIALPLIGAG